VNYGTLVADVTLPEDAKTYADPTVNKMKADRIILSNIRPLKDIFNGKTGEEILSAIKYTGKAPEYVPEELRSLELCKIAVQNSKTSIRFVPEKYSRNCMNILLWHFNMYLNIYGEHNYVWMQ